MSFLYIIRLVYTKSIDPKNSDTWNLSLVSQIPQGAKKLFSHWQAYIIKYDGTRGLGVGSPFVRKGFIDRIWILKACVLQGARNCIRIRGVPGLQPYQAYLECWCVEWAVGKYKRGRRHAEFAWEWWICPFATTLDVLASDRWDVDHETWRLGSSVGTRHGALTTRPIMPVNSAGDDYLWVKTINLFNPKGPFTQWSSHTSSSFQRNYLLFPWLCISLNQTFSGQASYFLEKVVPLDDTFTSPISPDSGAFGYGNQVADIARCSLHDG